MVVRLMSCGPITHFPLPVSDLPHRSRLQTRLYLVLRVVSVWESASITDGQELLTLFALGTYVAVQEVQL